MPSTSPRPGGQQLTAAREQLSYPQVKWGLLLTTGWRSRTPQRKAVSGRKTKTGFKVSP